MYEKDHTCEKILVFLHTHFMVMNLLQNNYNNVYLGANEVE